jgi:hypothetical protein
LCLPVVKHFVRLTELHTFNRKSILIIYVGALNITEINIYNDLKIIDIRDGSFQKWRELPFQPMPYLEFLLRMQ